MGKRVAGTVYFKVDGQQLEVSGGVEVPLGNFVREAVMGVNGPAGYKETARVPAVKLSAIFRDDFPIDLITDGDDMTITVEMPAGQVYTLSSGYMVGEPSAKADDGTVDLEFNGMRGQWQ